MPAPHPAMPKQTGGGNAPIIRQGHTTNGQFGSDPNKKAKGRQPVRELKP